MLDNIEITKAKIYSLSIIILMIIGVSYTFIQLNEAGEQSLQIYYDVNIRSEDSSQYTIYLPRQDLIETYKMNNDEVTIDGIKTEKGKLLKVSGNGSVTIKGNYEEDGNAMRDPINFSYPSRIRMSGHINDSIDDYWFYLEKNHSDDHIYVELDYKVIEEKTTGRFSNLYYFNESISEGWSQLESKYKPLSHEDQFGGLTETWTNIFIIDLMIIIMITIMIWLIRREGRGD